MDNTKLTNIHVRYHRNGIGGQGFFAIHFTSKGDGSEKEYDGKLICVIVPGDEESEDQYGFTGQCYVVKPSRTDLCFRGDNHEPDMRDILHAYELSWNSEYAKHQTAGTIMEGMTFKNMDEVTAIIKAGTINDKIG